MTVRQAPPKKRKKPAPKLPEPQHKKKQADLKTKKPKAESKSKGKLTPDDIADIKRRIEKQKIDRFKNRRTLPGRL